MTLIASLSTAKLPVLISDGLASGSPVHLDLSKVVLPNIKDLPDMFPEGWESVPTGLVQKIVIINRNLVVAWCGNLVFARMVLTQLKSNATPNKTYTPEELYHFFTNCPHFHTEHNDFIYMCNTGERICVRALGTGIHQERSPTFGNVLSGGSGQDDLVSLLRIMESLNTQTSSGISDIQYEISKLLLLCCQLNANEFNNGFNLYTWHGGFYEMAFFDKGGFRKFDEVTYLNWTLEKLSGNKYRAVFPGTILKHQYINEVLLIIRIQLLVTDSDDYLTIEEKLIVAPPLLRPEPFTKELERSGLHSPIVCTNLNFYDEENKAHAAANGVIVSGREDEKCIEILNVDGVQSFEWSRRYFESLQQLAKQIVAADIELEYVVRNP